MISKPIFSRRVSAPFSSRVKRKSRRNFYVMLLRKPSDSLLAEKDFELAVKLLERDADLEKNVYPEEESESMEKIYVALHRSRGCSLLALSLYQAGFRFPCRFFIHIRPSEFIRI